MTPQELISLGAAGVEIGLHTHRHNFPENDRFRAELEITDNRAALSRWGTNSTNHFCYPSGLWDERQWQWLDSMHVKSSATCLPGLNSQRTPRHALRRFLDGANIDQLEFEAAICGFSDLIREWAPGSRLASKLPRAQSQAVTPKL
jgi:peptidoglycan/xylan/chitin deacetylase (PgdA/CDA1 family)